MKTLSRGLFFLVLSLVSTSAFAAGGQAKGVPTQALIFAGINFLLIIGILIFFLRKPTKEFFASRSALIKKGMDEARSLKEEAEKKYRDYELRLKGIETETQGLVAQLKNDGDLERVRLLKAAEEQVQSMKATSERVMTQELRKAKEELKREAVALAAELAEELVRDNMTAEDQKRIVGEYLKKMEHMS